ncbi:diacylglycerol kinase [Ligilactobacillus ruminis DSM 20403 = NBRC 102161]|uniref:Diacylglycerol kinase (ATP) n=1 Tax=Ligilactobacillus ruminis DSM 20403 = NBRC 102161 TaxID=1423798 RepID=A0A1I2PZV4_9LACO|nr:diacylglycerol kinase [Ligilactobacillus ruminis ATCC 25644]KRM83637.1 diacylglycerol kinase [Ligilactobacillus ruminis DSM 20403 = NBRC 102161]CDC59901.1 diacylglycerol kinase [Ligilactobacillus ruminis CAG:367]SFG19537.1 diacylglycerol kinase (ATP) [Ligilactobacillus ruminis DSM 20403 = NBRC 102161]
MTAYREERNLRFHVGSVILVVIMGCLFHVSANEWLWLLLSIFFVLASEVWNTAIENAVDLASEYKKHPLAKKAKDTAAGGVLLAAVFSMIVGAIVFVPKIWQLLF